MREYRIEYMNKREYTRMMEGYNGYYENKAIVIEAEDKATAEANAAYVVPKNTVVVNITAA